MLNEKYSFLKELQRHEEKLSFESSVHNIYNPKLSEEELEL